MDKKIYNDIIGIEKFWKFFPEKEWFYFHEMLEFRWYREYDYEEWCDRFCLELTMSDLAGKDVVLFKFNNVSLNGKCDFSGWISGLEIVNLKYGDTSFETHYEICDFEDSHIHFYCDEIEIKVLKVEGENVFH